VGRLGALVAQARAEEVEVDDSTITIHRPAEAVVHVVRGEDGSYEVVGKAAERAVRFNNLEDDGALDEAIKRLERLGVDRMLSRAGIKEGNLVVVGDLEFSWWRDATRAGLNVNDLPRRRRKEKEPS
jgi:GTP-binding protein